MVRLSLAVLLSMLFFSCSGESHELETETVQDPFLIGVAISISDTTPFFASLIQGAQESAEIHNAELIVVSANQDPELQSAQIIELAAGGIDILLLNPVDDSVVPAVSEVCSSGIPVLTVDRGISCSCVVCHIASENRAGGMMAGEYLSEALHRSGRVVEIMGTAGSSAAIDRGLGFREAISNYGEIEIITAFYGDFSREIAEAGFLRILQEGGKIDGVFAHNDEMILGAMDAAASEGYHDIMFVGYDAIDEAVALVESGDLMATIAQRPAEMGHLAVETAVKELSGEAVPDSIIVDLALILR